MSNLQVAQIEFSDDFVREALQISSDAVIVSAHWTGNTLQIRAVVDIEEYVK